jgi:Mg-chelatase subunit ChlD
VTALVWTGAALCLLFAAALLIRRSRRSPALTLADASSFDTARRRTRLLWVTLAAGLVAALAAFAVTARAQTGEAPILKPGADAVVVVDLSGSALPSSRGIARVLLALTRDPRRNLGLVVFSDTAYTALPPSTPAEGLEGWLELFTNGDSWNYPWAPSFAGGTTISSGLVLARTLLHRAHVVHPRVVLVSDLFDSDYDLQRLETVTAEYQREGIDLTVIKVRPDALPSVAGLPNAGFVAEAADRTVDPSRPTGSVVPALLAGLVVLLALLAAFNELQLQPLTWRTRT